MNRTRTSLSACIQKRPGKALSPSKPTNNRLNHELQILQNVPLAPFTTLKIGGNARYFIRAENEQQVAAAVGFANRNALELFILGGGSNILIADAGFNGIVLQICISGIEISKSQISNLKSGIEGNEARLLTVGAGEDWDKFVEYCVKNKLAGVECLSGIPGFVGGTPVQNVGAYGQEVGDIITEVRCFDRTNGEIVTLSNAECGFSYRTSIFNSIHRDRFVVISVTFKLQSNCDPKVVYKDLIDYFADKTPSLGDVRDAVLKIRRLKSMVIDDADPNAKSAGSFFKNPVVSPQKLEEIKSLFESVPSFEHGDKFKIAAAWLIEQSGFHKGFKLGRAGISSRHTLALINAGDATAADIIALKEKIQQTVTAKFGIELQPEPVFVGF